MLNDNEKKLISKYSFSEKQINELLNNAEVISYDPIHVKKKLDYNTYSHIFKAYPALLKIYFNKYKIFVLTKLKHKNSFYTFFDILFKNSKKSIINEFSTFTPSFLAVKNNISILINFSNNIFEIEEIEIKNDEKSFIHNSYKYRKANEIKLK